MSPDHVHLLISVPPSISLSKAIQYIKGKSSRKLLQEFEVLHKRYWGEHLWARGYFAVTVGNVNAEDIQRYIEDQEALITKKTIFGSLNSSVYAFNQLYKRLSNYRL